MSSLKMLNENDLESNKSLGRRVSLIVIACFAAAIIILEVLAAKADIDGSLWVA